SYGGYMVLIGLALQPAIWAAGVDFFGISSFRSFIEVQPGAWREVAVSEFGDPETDGEFLDSISPMTHIDTIVDPLFVYQGENDPIVPRSQSDQIVKALREKNIPVEYMVAKGEGHSADRKENFVGLISRSARFLEEVLQD
ncbi:MAG: prolyl oligopeptidase family serine peptidase, partial [Pseudomonadota bacterium]